MFIAWGAVLVLVKVPEDIDLSASHLMLGWTATVPEFTLMRAESGYHDTVKYTPPPDQLAKYSHTITAAVANDGPYCQMFSFE